MKSNAKKQKKEAQLYDILKILPPDIQDKIIDTKKFPITRNDCVGFELDFDMGYTFIDISLITESPPTNNLENVLNNINNAVKTGLQNIKNDMLRSKIPWETKGYKSLGATRRQIAKWTILFKRKYVRISEGSRKIVFTSLQNNVRNSIMNIYNKKTRNEVHLLGTRNFESRYLKEKMFFEVCKPKNSLQELVKKRLQQSLKF